MIFVTVQEIVFKKFKPLHSTLVCSAVMLFLHTMSHCCTNSYGFEMRKAFGTLFAVLAAIPEMNEVPKGVRGKIVYSGLQYTVVSSDSFNGKNCYVYSRMSRSTFLLTSNEIQIYNTIK